MSVEGGSGTGAVATAGSGGRGGVSATAAPAMGRGGVESSFSPNFSISSKGEISGTKGFTTHSLSKDHHTKVNNSPMFSDRQVGQTEMKGLTASPAATQAKETATPKVNTAPKMSLSGLPELKVTSPDMTDTFNTQESVNDMTIIAKAPFLVSETPQRLNTKTEGSLVQQPEVRFSISPEGKLSGIQQSEVSKAFQINTAENSRQAVKAQGTEVNPSLKDVLSSKVKETNLEKINHNPIAVNAIKKSGEPSSKSNSKNEVEKFTQLYLERFVLPHTTQQTKLENKSSVKEGKALTFVQTASADNDQKIVRSAQSAAKEFQADMQEGVRLMEIAQALKQSALPGTEWAQIDPQAIALRAADHNQERTQVKNAVIQAVEIGRQEAKNDEETQTETQQQYQDSTVVKVKTDARPQTATATQTEVQTAAKPQTYVENGLTLQDEEDLDTEVAVATAEEAALLELQDQPIETTQVSSNGSTATQTTTVLQGNTVREEITKVRLVRDDNVNELRIKYAVQAAKVIFDAQANNPTPMVTGADIAQLLPDEVEQPGEVKSQLLRGFDHVNSIDGSYRGYVAEVSKAGQMTSESQSESVATTAANRNTAVRAEETTEVIQREATDAELQNVLDPTSRNTRRPAA